MELIKMYIPGIPVPKGRPQFNSKEKKAYTPKKTREFEERVSVFGKAYMNKYELKAFSQPLDVEIVVYKKIPKSWSKKKKQKALDGLLLPTTPGDVDNYAKSILDGLNGVTFKDDKFIISLKVSKTYAEFDGLRIYINSIDDSENAS